MKDIIKKGLNIFANAKIFRPRTIRYVFSGCTAAFATLSLTWLFEQTGMNYILVVTLAYLLSVMVSFSLQKFFTFENRGLEKVHGQVAIYFALAAINLLINDFLVYILFSGFRVQYLVFDQAISTVLIAIYSFFIYRHIIFKNTPHAENK